MLSRPLLLHGSSHVRVFPSARVSPLARVFSPVRGLSPARGPSHDGSSRSVPMEGGGSDRMPQSTTFLFFSPVVCPCLLRLNRF